MAEAETKPDVHSRIGWKCLTKSAGLEFLYIFQWAFLIILIGVLLDEFPGFLVLLGVIALAHLTKAFPWMPRQSQVYPWSRILDLPLQERDMMLREVYTTTTTPREVVRVMYRELRRKYLTRLMWTVVLMVVGVGVIWTVLPTAILRERCLFFIEKDINASLDGGWIDHVWFFLVLPVVYLWLGIAGCMSFASIIVRRRMKEAVQTIIERKVGLFRLPFYFWFAAFVMFSLPVIQPNNFEYYQTVFGIFVYDSSMIILSMLFLFSLAELLSIRGDLNKAEESFIQAGLGEVG